MGSVSQIEFSEAEVNPSDQTFKEALGRAKGLIILDIGSGNRLSMSLKKGDLYVMVDPNLDPHSSLNSGFNRREPGSQIVGFSSEIDDVPDFRPNLTLMVAPNPVDILEGDLLQDSLRFIRASQAVMVVFDKITIESAVDPRTLKTNFSGLKLAKDKVIAALRAQRFQVETRGGNGEKIDDLLEDVGIQRRGVLNSADLSASKSIVLGYR